MPANQITVAGASSRCRREPREGRECAVETELSPDFRMVYNHAHGIPASTAGRFPLKGNYTTKIQRPTVLSWAFSFVLPA